MATTFHERTVMHSQKVRQCSWCATEIAVGEPYHGYTYRDDKDTTGRVTLHLCCYEALKDASHKEGDWIYWTDGDFEKGCCCPAGDCCCGKEQR